MQKLDTTKVPTGLELYTQAAQAAAREVIYSYSTSFGLATRLLSKSHRRHVENIYALVRVADEIVDGSASEAQAIAPQVDPEAELLAFETETYKAMRNGFSTNLIIHAFATSCEEVGISEDLVKPFFASMRADLSKTEHNQESFEQYVYGSAEVVGLMCLAAFVKDKNYNADQKVQLVRGARALGAAFQKVNFLRDLSADFRKLGRSYFPNVNISNFDEQTKARLVADIQKDLEISSQSLPLLPKDARRAVTAAQLLFAELNKKIGNTRAEELIKSRISVSNLKKLVLLIQAVFGVKS